MNKHQFFDNLATRMGSMYGNSLKFFNRGTESPTVGELIARTQVEVPAPDGPKEYETEAKLGEERIPLRYTVVRWAGVQAPVLIFHHGSGDQPYHSRIRKILGGESPDPPVTVIATDSPYNRTRKEYYHAIGDLRSFATLLSVSACLVEGVIRSLHRKGGKRPGASSGTSAPAITVAGISLGGWITNLHHAYFNTADVYRPIFAGATPDALFLESSYSRLTSGDALNQPERVTDVLNFEETFRKQGTDNVYALLARYDQYVQLERQKIVYDPGHLAVMEAGHITGSSRNAELRQFLFAR